MYQLTIEGDSGPNRSYIVSLNPSTTLRSELTVTGKQRSSRTDAMKRKDAACEEVPSVKLWEGLAWEQTYLHLASKLIYYKY
jgi:hypothetical protein